MTSQQITSLENKTCVVENLKRNGQDCAPSRIHSFCLSVVDDTIVCRGVASSSPSSSTWLFFFLPLLWCSVVVVFPSHAAAMWGWFFWGYTLK
jgi:hypothetical protein